MLQIGAALFYYKLGQTLLQIGVASLLQIRATVITNWGSYYKLGQPLLQNRAAITNWVKMYYKLGQVLQIRAIIIGWGITDVNTFEDKLNKLEKTIEFEKEKNRTRLEKVWQDNHELRKKVRDLEELCCRDNIRTDGPDK